MEYVTKDNFREISMALLYNIEMDGCSFEIEGTLSRELG